DRHCERIRVHALRLAPVLWSIRRWCWLLAGHFSARHRCHPSESGWRTIRRLGFLTMVIGGNSGELLRREKWRLLVDQKSHQVAPFAVIGRVAARHCAVLA